MDGEKRPPPTRSPLQERLAAQQAALEARAAVPFDAAQTGGLFGRGGTLGLGLGSDPWEATMARTVNPFIKRMAGDTAESVSQYVLPQNAPELAVAGLTALSPVGLIAGKGTMAGLKGTRGVVTRALTKGAESAAGAGATAAVTGHRPGESALAGGIGGAVAQGAGELVAAGAQAKGVSKLVADAGRRVQGAMRTIFNDTLIPAGESAAASVKRIINGDVVSAVQQDIGGLFGRRYLATAPSAGFETDSAIRQLVQANPGLDLKSGGVPSFAKMWARLPGERDALARFLPAHDLAKYGAARTKLEGAQLAQDLFLNGRTPTQASAALFEKGTGSFTPEGLIDLQKQFGALTRRELALLGPGAQELGAALYQDTAKGVQAGVAGEWPTVSVALDPKNLLHAIPHASGGTLPWQPGWEKATGTVRIPGLGVESTGAALAQAGAKALTTPTIPRAFGAGDRPTAQPETPPLPAPSSAAIQPIEPKPEAAPSSPATSWFTGVPPPPERPSPPAWFKPDAETTE